MSSNIGAPSLGSGVALSGVAIPLRHPSIELRDQRNRLGVPEAVEQCIDQESSRRSPHDRESFEFSDAMFSSK